MQSCLLPALALSLSSESLGPSSSFHYGRKATISQALVDCNTASDSFTVDGDPTCHMLSMKHRSGKVQLLYTPHASEHFVVRINDEIGSEYHSHFMGKSVFGRADLGRQLCLLISLNRWLWQCRSRSVPSLADAAIHVASAISSLFLL
jgi:hypothetical protein